MRFVHAGNSYLTGGLLKSGPIKRLEFRANLCTSSMLPLQPPFRPTCTRPMLGTLHSETHLAHLIPLRTFRVVLHSDASVIRIHRPSALRLSLWREGAFSGASRISCQLPVCKSCAQAQVVQHRQILHALICSLLSFTALSFQPKFHPLALCLLPFVFSTLALIAVCRHPLSQPPVHLSVR